MLVRLELSTISPPHKVEFGLTKYKSDNGINSVEKKGGPDEGGLDVD